MYDKFALISARGHVACDDVTVSKTVGKNSYDNKRRLLNSVSAVALSANILFIIGLSNQAFAACVGSGSVGNDTIVCTGPDTVPGIGAQTGTDSITLDGTAGALNVTGNVRSGNGANDFIGITGTVNVDGDVILSGTSAGDGDGDSLIAGGATLTVDGGNGQVAGGEDTDAFLFSNSTLNGNVNAGGSADSVAIEDNSVITGNVDAGGGADIVGILSGSEIGGNLSAGNGDDIVGVLGGSSVGGNLNTGDGADTVVVVEGSSVGEDISTGGGVDRVGIDGAATMIRGDVDLGQGNDTLIVENGTIDGEVAMGAGADEVTINGGTLNSGIGREGVENDQDTITINGGTIRSNPNDSRNAAIFAGEAADHVGIFGGTVEGPISLAADNDLLVIDDGADEFDPAVWTRSTPLSTAPLNMTNTVFYGGGGNQDTAEIYDLTVTDNLVFDGMEFTRFYGQSITLHNTLNRDSGFYLKDDAAGNHSMLTQTDGELDIRNGGTSVLSVDNLNVVTMQDGAVDDSIRVQRLEPNSGSIFRFDIDATNETADVIEVNNVVREAGGMALINGAFVNPGAVPLTGSIALIDDINNAGPARPEIGDTDIQASEYFVWQNDPSTAARTFYLVDENGNEGVYVQWTTNVNTTTLSGLFGGSVTAGTGPTDPNLIVDPEESGGGAFAVAQAASVANVSTHIGDLASIDAGALANGPLPADPNQPGSEQTGYEGQRARTALQCQDGTPLRGWVGGHADRVEFGDTNTNSSSVHVGAEADLGTLSDFGCGQLLAGVFGYIGNADAKDELGSNSDGDVYGGGGFLRFATNDGFYGSILGHYGRSDGDNYNAVLGATSDIEGPLYGFAGNLGKMTHLTSQALFEVRAYGGITYANPDDFTDSMGLTYANFKTKVKVIGAFAGVRYRFTPGSIGFARVGIKHTKIEQSVTAAAIGVSVEPDYTTGTVELGFDQALSSNAYLSLSGVGEFGDDVRGIGGKARVSIRY